VDTVASAENVIKPHDSLKTLRQVCLIFFLLIGSAHLLTGLLVSQGQMLPLSNIINRVLDIPFVIIGTVLGLSQTKIAPDSSFRRTWFIIMGIITLLILGLMLYINVFLPDKIV
jgi:ABC-type sulfate transport system permease component